MALYDRIQVELVESRRRRDQVTLDTLALLKSELVKASKENAAGGRIDDELVVRVARKEVKRREEAIEVYRKAGRVDSARREEAEMALLKVYLPAAMSDEAVEAEVAAVIAEVKPEGAKGFGMVMKQATARLAGRAEGAHSHWAGLVRDCGQLDDGVGAHQRPALARQNSRGRGFDSGDAVWARNRQAGRELEGWRGDCRLRQRDGQADGGP